MVQRKVYKMDIISKLELNEILSEIDFKMIKNMFSSKATRFDICVIFERNTISALESILEHKEFSVLNTVDAKIPILRYKDLNDFLNDFSQIVSFHLAPVYFIFLAKPDDYFLEVAQNSKYTDWLDYIKKNYIVFAYCDYVLEDVSCR